VVHLVMYHQQNSITLLHWCYPLEVVQSFLAAGQTANIWDGVDRADAWPQGGARPPGPSALPHLSESVFCAAELPLSTSNSVPTRIVECAGFGKVPCDLAKLEIQPL
jgi:hypothetical protein